MNLYDAWDQALKTTEILRPRIRGLSSSSSTKLPYVFLAESSINSGDSVVRRGEIEVGKPSIILPSNLPQITGFDFEDGEEINPDAVMNFLLVRGVQIPSLKYNNLTSSVDIFEGKLSEAIKSYLKKLQRTEDTETTLLTGGESLWQFALLIFIGLQASRSAQTDFKYLIDEWRRKGGLF